MASSYSGLKFARKDCGRYTPNYLEFRLEEEDAFSSSVASSTVYVRFVSDDTVHHKGFSFEFFAASSSGKLQFEFFNRIEKTTGFRVEVRETVFIKYIQGTQREKYVKYVVGPLQSVGIFISPATFRKSRKTCNNAI